MDTSERTSSESSVFNISLPPSFLDPRYLLPLPLLPCSTSTFLADGAVGSPCLLGLPSGALVLGDVFWANLLLTNPPIPLSSCS